MRRLLTAIGVGLLVGSSLVACAGSAGASDDDEPVFYRYDTQVVRPLLVDMPDGRTVECVIFDGYKAGGLSCNWNTP